MQLKPIQQFVSQKATAYLSKELNTTISLSTLYIKPFSSIVLTDLYVQDLDRDTLLFVEEFSAALDLSSIWNSKLVLNQVKVAKGTFFLKKYADGGTNISFLQRYFKPSEQPKKSSSFDIRFPSLVFQDMEARYRNELQIPVESGINYRDVHIQSLSGKLSAIDFKKHLFKANIEHLSFKEKSGLHVKELSAKAIIDTSFMEFSELNMELNASHIQDYVRFTYGSFSDFSNFITKVQVKGNLKNSKINSQDIAFFAPQVNITQFDVMMTGELSGTVDNILGKNVEIRTGKETWLNGELSIKGLPQIEETLFDMNLSRLRSTRRDLESLIGQLSRHREFALPEIFDRFGKIDYKGRITGFYSNFIAQGMLTTQLGTLLADINLDIRNEGKYSGTVFSPEFEVGQLLQLPDLGQASFRANIVGTGLSEADLHEQLKGSLAYIDYKGYRYQHIDVDGTYFSETFTGDIGIKDENISLDFEGELDLSRKNLEYNFKADIAHLDLRKLQLTSDSLAFSGKVEADFTGNSLSTLDGRLFVQDLGVYRSMDSTFVDSMLMFTQMEGEQRVLAIESEIADAKIKGAFELSSLPSYFKHLTKTYIPSLRTEIHEYGPQEFDFELKVKNFEPIALIFVPDLTIPDEVAVTGKFSTLNNNATLTGYVPELSYKKIKVTDLIFDQTTNAEALNLFITANRVDVTDSLYIQNVNMATVLRNDSLNFNIKLSDLEASNQLDLNGMVEFKKDSAAQLSLLPSKVIINREPWEILDQVRLDFDQGRTKVNGLEFSQGEQTVTVNGIISRDESEVLSINFDKFLLSTLNSLTKPFGVILEGELNGEIKVNSLLNQPYVLSDIQTKTIQFNGIVIGDMALQAGWNRASRLVELDMEVLNNKQKSIQLSGTYDPKQAINPLSLDLKMEQGDLQLFQPFLRKLVSNLTGKATVDLNVNGTVFNPLINGTIALSNASFVVNYLKTPYTINDTVGVQDSKILLNNLRIEDAQQRHAIANGTVDMSKPLNPDIQVDIQANEFMVLKTSAKDNPLYYGTAFGTGMFSFHGPTDDMTIRIEATTNAGTDISLPLNSSETLTDKDFISFVSADSAVLVKRVNSFQGLTMTLDLTVNQDARANIFTDLGKLSGNGEGLLSMKISSLGDFEMFGDYTISTGEFEFTAQDFINKKFEINRGGSIRWTGNPTDALINLTTVYGVRTSVRPLYIAAGRGEGSDQRVVAQAEMLLNGNLLHPEINFNINFPTDSYIKDELQSYFSDANNVNQQALSLIVRRSFAPGTGTDLTRELNTTVLSAGTELAFNQLNNIISQSLNLNFVDFNIRSFNEASASIRLLSNRLILTGGVTDRRGELNDFNVFGKEVVSDLEAIYLIRSSGNLMLRASNRLNNRNILNPTDEYVSAIGLVYRQDFDTFKEFFQRLLFFGSGKRKENESAPKEPVNHQPE